jgi:hypothetical protein
MFVSASSAWSFSVSPPIVLRFNLWLDSGGIGKSEDKRELRSWKNLSEVGSFMMQESCVSRSRQRPRSRTSRKSCASDVVFV